MQAAPGGTALVGDGVAGAFLDLRKFEQIVGVLQHAFTGLFEHIEEQRQVQSAGLPARKTIFGTRSVWLGLSRQLLLTVTLYSLGLNMHSNFWFSSPSWASKVDKNGFHKRHGISLLDDVLFVLLVHWLLYKP